MDLYTSCRTMVLSGFVHQEVAGNFNAIDGHRSGLYWKHRSLQWIYFFSVHAADAPSLFNGRGGIIADLLGTTQG